MEEACQDLAKTFLSLLPFAILGLYRALDLFFRALDWTLSKVFSKYPRCWEDNKND